MDIVWTVIPALLRGTKVTLALFAETLIISLPLGLLLGLAATSQWRFLRAVISCFTWIIRGTPLLLQIFFIYYALPFVSHDLVFDRFPAAVIAFAINYTAYFIEIFRGGIQAVPRGQFEAASVLGLTKGQTIRKIMIPQVVKTILPAIGNEVITLVKDTALVYAVGLTDLMRAGQIALQREAVITPLLVVGVFYLILTAVVTLVLRYCEKRVSYYE